MEVTVLRKKILLLCKIFFEVFNKFDEEEVKYMEVLLNYLNMSPRA